MILILFQELEQMLSKKLSPKAFRLNSEIYGLHYDKISRNKIIKKVLVDVNNSELARTCVEKKIRIWGNLGREDFKKKILSYLKRRGFNYDVSLNAYRQAWSLLNNRNRPSIEDRDQTLNRK